MKILTWLLWDDKGSAETRGQWLSWMFFHWLRTGRWESGYQTYWIETEDGWKELPIGEPFPLDRKPVISFREKEAPGDVNPSRSEPEGLGIYSEDASGPSGRRKRRRKPPAIQDDERQEKLFG